MPPSTSAVTWPSATSTSLRAVSRLCTAWARLRAESATGRCFLTPASSALRATTRLASAIAWAAARPSITFCIAARKGPATASSLMPSITALSA